MTARPRPPLLNPAQAEALKRMLTGPTAGSPRATWDRSYDSLVRGDLPKGWDDYEARLQVPGLITPQRAFQEPRWDGTPFPGKTLLLHYEQGLGDTLMFVRYASGVKALGGTVLLQAQASLAELVATCPGVDQVIPKGAPLPPFDLQISLLSLPAVFRTDLASIPDEVPYLSVPARVPNRAALDEVLGRSEGTIRIGLAWQGSRDHPRDRERSVPAETLAPLAQLPHTTWHSFQREEDLQPPFDRITHLGPLLGSFSDSAHAVAQMDLVITVDTALAHLAGALGVPVLLLVTQQPDWRWLLDREDSPWYPTVRLYRQKRPGQWAEVVARIVRDLGAGA